MRVLYRSIFSLAEKLFPEIFVDSNVNVSNEIADKKNREC